MTVLVVKYFTYLKHTALDRLRVRLNVYLVLVYVQCHELHWTDNNNNRDNTSNATVKAVNVYRVKAVMTDSDLTEVVADLFHIHFIVVCHPATADKPPLRLWVL